MSEQQFQVGDLVEAFGLSGKVKQIILSAQYPVLVEFENGINESFMPNGKVMGWHKAPSLKLISRPQKTEKKKVWVRAYENKPMDGTCDLYVPNKEYYVQIEAEVPVEE